MSWAGFAVALVQLFVMMFQTFFSERAKKAEADAKNEKYDIDFEKMALLSLERWKAERQKRSKQARDLDRQMEDDLK